MAQKSDIWGEPQEECFYCGTPYNPEHSTAPPEFQGTYCTVECYTHDHAHMQQAAQKEQEQPVTSAPEHQQFKLKVPKGWDKV